MKISTFAICFIVALFISSQAIADLKKVENKEGLAYYHGDPNKKIVALTFDDGPYEPYTSEILGILKSNNIKATFFLIGDNVNDFPECAKKIVQDGHAIGNHTYYHPDLRFISALGIRREIKNTDDIIFNTTGIKTGLFRPPYTCVNERINREANDLGYTVIGWSLSAKDGGKKIKSDKIVELVLPYVRNGSIILLHDGDRIKGSSRKETVKALPEIIKVLKEAGYRFATIPELLNIPQER